MSTLHQVHLFTSTPSKTWASCATCGRKSKQGTKANAEAWMARHQTDTTQEGKATR